MNKEIVTFVQRWLDHHPDFSGSIELHMNKGKLSSIKTHQTHRDVLTPSEQKRFRRPV